ncbi:unnamed protein product [Psylliodes chrysocephalus]|uniref:Uncharacterized protein n=1 Tax=Psylliodes chrysocephalus TaxID=3402493 RepID=A0A9P0D2T2_9CUCU|nr:unnamed protein product [Psylliodes chrysocephala]
MMGVSKSTIYKVIRELKSGVVKPPKKIAEGGVCLLAAVIITTLEIINPHSFSTILEEDYDTPFDRHVIIEESRGKRFEKKKTNTSLEEANSLGRILRRLNSKNKEDEEETNKTSNRSNTNEEFHLEPSPWTYPYKKNDSRSSVSIISSTMSITASPVCKDQLRYNNDPVQMW